jgi:hypothetical protein
MGGVLFSLHKNLNTVTAITFQSGMKKSTGYLITHTRIQRDLNKPSDSLALATILNRIEYNTCYS